MATEGADPRYLAAREMDMWLAEAERTQNRLDDLKQASSDAAIEQAWYDYCSRKHQALAWEFDKIENPQRSPAEANVVSLDDLDRQTD